MSFAAVSRLIRGWRGTTKDPSARCVWRTRGPGQRKAVGSGRDRPTAPGCAVRVEVELQPVDADGRTCVADRTVEFGNSGRRFEDAGIDFVVAARIAARDR
jgi:hypothetical protein